MRPRGSVASCFTALPQSLCCYRLDKQDFVDFCKSLGGGQASGKTIAYSKANFGII